MKLPGENCTYGEECISGKCKVFSEDKKYCEGNAL